LLKREKRKKEKKRERERARENGEKIICTPLFRCHLGYGCIELG
jgi:hypothetical protein